MNILNIENYNDNELLELFKLSKNYSKNDLLYNENIIKKKILQDNELNKNVKHKLIRFIESCKYKLLETINNPNENVRFSELENITNEVITHKNAEYLNSFPSEYFQGVINPLKKRIINKYINIDSRFRENYMNTQSTDFMFLLPIELKKMVSIELVSLEFPTTFFTISSVLGNNYFQLEIPGKQYFMIILENGTYSISEFENYINQYLLNSTSFEGGFYTYISCKILVNISNNGDTGQMQFNINAGAPFTTFNINLNVNINGEIDKINPLNLKLGWIMGFRQNTYVNQSSYISEGIVDLKGYRYLYLVLDDFNNNVNNLFYSAFNSSILNNNIIAKICMNNPSLSIFVSNNFNVVTSPRNYFGPVDLNKLHVQLIDEYGRVIDLHYMDFSFCLRVQVIYDL